jgi:GNAT superfamily N-acetyltransferase
MYRAPVPSESPTLVSIAVATKLFTEQDADLLLRQTLDGFHAGRLGEGHHVYVCTDDNDRPVGWTYFARNGKADGVWDLWWIGIAPPSHGRGLGKALLAYAEDVARDNGARLLIIETSSLPLLAHTREFYRQRGYTECGTVPDFYGEGDGKVTFARRL